MKSAAQTLPNTKRESATFPPLFLETRSHVDTACAAFHLSRKPRTLRGWATGEIPGPIAPQRVNGRLSWAVSDLRKVLGAEVSQ